MSKDITLLNYEHQQKSLHLLVTFSYHTFTVHFTSIYLNTVTTKSEEIEIDFKGLKKLCLSNYSNVHMLVTHDMRHTNFFVLAAWLLLGRRFFLFLRLLHHW